MCGLAGLVAPRLEAAELRRRADRMRAGIASRGPDGQGELFAPGVALVHSRLAIIDPEGGHQPIWNEDRTAACVFNGEIYGYKPLLARLEAAGHTLATRSDTEVLVHLYEDHGPGLVDHVHGMYAFAIHDAVRGKVVLGRDRLGIKPLYWSRGEGWIGFASALDSLVAAGASRDPDREALVQYLRYGKVPEPRTVYAGIRALPPGHVVVIDVATGRVESERAFTREPRERPATGDAVARARAAFERAIASHMVADVEVAAFLSGGIDSSLVVAQAQRLSSRRLRTFCVGFTGSGDHDESRFAARVAREAGTDHETIEVTAAPADLVREALAAAQQPFAVASFLPLLLLCKQASRRVKVVLTGDGGDEVGFGYPWYRWMRAVSRVTRGVHTTAADGALGAVERAASRLPGGTLARRGTKFLRGALGGEAFASDVWRYDLTFADAAGLLRPEHRPSGRVESPGAVAWDAELPPVEALRHMDIDVQLRDEMLPKLDRAGMAHGLEGRVPLLDDEFVDAMLDVPPEVHLADPKGKGLLRAWARELVPGIDAERPKHGFDVPIRSWLETSLRDDVRRLLLEPERPGLLDPAAASRVWERASRGTPGAAHATYAMLMLELWFESVG